MVLDLGMPGMGGRKALRAILEFDPRARVVIASGYSPDAQGQAALGDGAVGYLARPYRAATLLVAVRAGWPGLSRGP